MAAIHRQKARPNRLNLYLHSTLSSRQVCIRGDKENETQVKLDLRRLRPTLEIDWFIWNIQLSVQRQNHWIDVVGQRESSEQTANLCLQLFRQVGVKEISINDIDSAHRVPARKPLNRPNAVICKFVRRLAKGKVMTARRAVRNIVIQQLGFSSEIDATNLNIYDHLTPRLQNLLFEAKKFKDAKNFKFCWAKNGFVYLRESETSPIRKFSDIEELNAFVRGCNS